MWEIYNVQGQLSMLIFFWLLPYLRDCVGIITDTWSISSISMECKPAARGCNLQRGGDRCALPCGNA